LQLSGSRQCRHRVLTILEGPHGINAIRLDRCPNQVRT
jgi:hypothetical protein